MDFSRLANGATDVTAESDSPNVKTCSGNDVPGIVHDVDVFQADEVSDGQGNVDVDDSVRKVNRVADVEEEPTMVQRKKASRQPSPGVAWADEAVDDLSAEFGRPLADTPPRTMGLNTDLIRQLVIDDT